MAADPGAKQGALETRLLAGIDQIGVKFAPEIRSLGTEPGGFGAAVRAVRFLYYPDFRYWEPDSAIFSLLGSCNP